MDAGKDETNFEDSMKRLEEIVARLENPELGLEEGMALYKEGVQCSRFCREKLEKAQHELEIWQNGAAMPANIKDYGDDKDSYEVPF